MIAIRMVIVSMAFTWKEFAPQGWLEQRYMDNSDG